MKSTKFQPKGKFIPFNPDLILKNTQVKREYDQLQPEFALIRAMLDARTKQGLSQADIAKQMGTKQAVISRIETGKANPSLNFLKRLAEVLNLNLKITFTPR